MWVSATLKQDHELLFSQATSISAMNPQKSGEMLLETLHPPQGCVVLRSPQLFLQPPNKSVSKCALSVAGIARGERDKWNCSQFRPQGGHPSLAVPLFMPI